METPHHLPPFGRIGAPSDPVESNPKWIRGSVTGSLVVDSTDSLLVWEVPYYPQWYFSPDSIVAELRPTADPTASDRRSSAALGHASVFDLVVGADGPDRQVLVAAAWRYEDSPIEAIRDRVRIAFGALDRWTEEEIEVIVHPRSPYVRVDVLPSTRRLEVAVGGQVVATTDRAAILYETGLPPRFYLPPDDVAPGMLRPSSTTTACPYKGIARYWDVVIDGDEHPDLVWGYDDPLAESALVEGLVCFYNEKVELTLDGEPLSPPVTTFS